MSLLTDLNDIIDSKATEDAAAKLAGKETPGEEEGKKTTKNDEKYYHPDFIKYAAGKK